MKSELYPGVEVYAPMLISKAPAAEKLEKELSSDKYFGQVKKDGYLYQLVKGKGGETYLFSRSLSKKTGFFSEKLGHVPHLKEWAEELPNGTTLIGEIYYPGKKSSDVTKIMGALESKAIARQKDQYGPIHFYIHDMIEYDNHSLLEEGFEKRFSKLCEHIDIGMPSANWLEVAGVFENYCGDISMPATIQRLFNEGEEGAVLKLKSGLYVPGKRPTYNFKVKEQVDNIDLVIMELLDPVKEYTGKEIETWAYWLDGEPVTKAYYYGWKNAFKVGAYLDGKLVEVGRVASGLTDEMREDCAKNPDKYIGQTVELQAMSLNKKDYTLRHPRFIRMRPDKNPVDCRIDEIFS